MITAFSAVPRKGAGSTYDMIKIGIDTRDYRGSRPVAWCAKADLIVLVIDTRERKVVS